MKIEFISELGIEVANGKRETITNVTVLCKDSTIIPRKGSYITIKGLSEELARKVRVDPMDPRFIVSSVEHCYHSQGDHSRIIIKMMSVDYYNALPWDGNDKS